MASVMTQDTRPVALRVVLWFGLAVLLVLGVMLTAVGLVDDGSGRRGALLVFGLVALVCAAGGLAREVAEASIRRDPPQPRLDTLDGEPALHLPRAAGPTLVSSWMLAGLAAVSALGALLNALDGRWGWALTLGAIAAYLGWSSAVHRGSQLAGGLWFTPTRLRHEDRSTRVEVSWDEVTGVEAHQPMPVRLRPDHAATIGRTGPLGRSWRPLGRRGTLTVDTQHLAGGSLLASYVIQKAITDPASRRVLGSPESLPPA